MTTLLAIISAALAAIATTGWYKSSATWREKLFLTLIQSVVNKRLDSYHAAPDEEGREAVLERVTGEVVSKSMAMPEEYHPLVRKHLAGDHEPLKKVVRNTLDLSRPRTKGQ